MNCRCKLSELWKQFLQQNEDNNLKQKKVKVHFSVPVDSIDDLKQINYIIVAAIIQSMSNGKLKYKLISCSSEEEEFPVSSLLFVGSQGWQTRRFCTYPQEITLQFYGIVNIRKIELVSDHRKISSQVDILYYLPVGNNDQRFYKYGYLQFNRNEGANIREQKTIMVDINCLYLRFLFHKPHQAKDNFFSQIGIQSLSLYGSDELSEMTYQPQIAQEDINEEDAEYIEETIARLTAQKQSALQQQDFQNANYYKNTIGIIHQLAGKLGQNRNKIKKALQIQDYDTAKMIKKQIDQYKTQIQQILQSKQKPSQQIDEMQQNQFAPHQEKYTDQQGNEFMENQPIYQQLTISRQTKLANSRPSQPQNQQNYDNRVIPTLRQGRTKSENQQLGDQNPKPPPPVQEVQGKFIKQATSMQEYFDELTVKKFFSIHWQHNMDSLTTILSDARKHAKDLGFLKCLINVVKLSGKQTNFQVSQLSLAVLVELLKLNSGSQLISKPGDLQNDLDQIGKEVIRRLTDNNPKIKTGAESAFAQMIGSSLYGVEVCSHALAKSKSKLSSKQLATRLSLITKMIEQYGVAGSPNTVPLTCLDFALQNIKNPAQQVRRASVALLSAAYKKDKSKVQSKLGGIKQSILDQIQEDAINISQKLKKK